MTSLANIVESLRVSLTRAISSHLLYFFPDLLQNKTDLSQTNRQSSTLSHSSTLQSLAETFRNFFFGHDLGSRFFFRLQRNQMKTTKLSFKMRPKSTWLSFFFFCVLLHIMIRASNGDFDGDGSSSSPRSRSESWLRWKRWLPWVFASAAAAALYCWSTFTEDFYNCGGGSEAILL